MTEGRRRQLRRIDIAVARLVNLHLATIDPRRAPVVDHEKVREAIEYLERRAKA